MGETRDMLHRSIIGSVNYDALADAKSHMEQLDNRLRQHTLQERG